MRLNVLQKNRSNLFLKSIISQHLGCKKVFFVPKFELHTVHRQAQCQNLKIYISKRVLDIQKIQGFYNILTKNCSSNNCTLLLKNKNICRYVSVSYKSIAKIPTDLNSRSPNEVFIKIREKKLFQPLVGFLQSCS